MKIAIISDIHDQLTQLKKALVILKDADVLLCCGDLCSPFIIKALGEGFSKPIHIVFGNNDGDLFRITQNSRPYAHIKLHGELAQLELDGMRFGMQHFDNIARLLADSGKFDVMCFGHNHQFEISSSGPYQLINPGEIYGGLSGHSTAVIYDTKSRTAERVDIPMNPS
ncbi:YfcE family phosphodiesterase [bacterium]|nr:YfcE family phosphodiesterase [bacterium]